MSVADKIAAVIARVGRPMTLRRLSPGPNGVQAPLDVTINAVSRNYSLHELISGSGITQGDTEVTFSNAEIAAAQWPGPPKKNDIIVFDGRNAKIVAVDPKSLGQDLLVYSCQVTG